MTWERMTILVTVKAYPAVSRKHGEAVCVAGLRTDTETPEWARLFPVAFRDLEFSQQFKKYQVVTLNARRSTGDKRPESWTPNTDSLELGEVLDTQRRWAQRRRYVDPVRIESMCELRRRQQADQTSLGALQPADVDGLLIDEAPPWSSGQEATVKQPSMLMPEKSELEWLPYRFRYSYRCANAGCGGHQQSIVDWEIGAAWRDWSRRYGRDTALKKIRTKWHDEICGPTKDTVFFVGNQHQHPDGFLVLGVFWPPRADDTGQGGEVQPTLFT